MSLSGHSSQASDQSSQVGVQIILGFSKEVYANADDIGVNLQPVKIKHMANQKKVCCDQRYQDKIAH